MPLVTLTIRKPKTAAFKTNVLDAVHATLVSSGAPPGTGSNESSSSKPMTSDLTRPTLM